MTKYVKNYGVVVFLDALGTKGGWKDSEPKNLIRKWESLVKKTKNYFKQAHFKGVFSLYAFSDTIIIVGKENKIDALMLEIGRIIKAIIMAGIFYEFYFRGCISVGEFYESENIIIGPAIDEASQYYETTNWIGVSVTPSAYSVLQRLKESNEKELNRYFVQYNIPLKNGIENGWAIVLHHDFKFSSISRAKTQLTKQKSFKEFIHQQLEHPKDPDSGQKWKNTLDFILYLKSKSELEKN